LLPLQGFVYMTVILYAVIPDLAQVGWRIRCAYSWFDKRTMNGYCMSIILTTLNNLLIRFEIVQSYCCSDTDIMIG
jgi:hypothetical protein